MLFAPSVCKGGLRSHFNLISGGREPAREVAGISQSGTGGQRGLAHLLQFFAANSAAPGALAKSPAICSGRPGRAALSSETFMDKSPAR